MIIYKLPRSTREEIQATLQIHDLRQTRVYQDGKREGIEEGLVLAKAIAKLVAANKTVTEIAATLGVSVEPVQGAISTTDHK